MKVLNREKKLMAGSFSNNRRSFLKKGVLLGTATSVAGVALLTGCSKNEEEEVSPPEDLMREHGLLNRILLIYDYSKALLENDEDFSPDILRNSAGIIRNFIEEYHEKLEENFLFPRFEKAGQLVDLVHTLKDQHAAGRKITGKIINICEGGDANNEEGKKVLIKLFKDFNTMYRPHEAREDTVLFPALRKIVSDNEFYSLGEDFEKKEHELFGEDGFENMVDKVAGLEKQLGIYDLAEFTPND